MMQRQKRYVLVAVIALTAAACAFAFWPRATKARPVSAPEPDRPAVAPPSEAAPAATRPAAPAPATSQASANPPGASQPASAPALSPGATSEAYKKGMEAMKKDRLVEARDLLSAAYFSGTLDAETQEKTRKTLSELAEFTLFSGTVVGGDPYTLAYTFKPGEVLVRVERDLKLHVPTQILAKINGMKDGRGIRAGQTVKLIQGPFHAVVNKSAFTMDLFLQSGSLPRVYVATVRVGIGKGPEGESSTPVGKWHVGLGKKLMHAPWNPPATSGRQGGSIAWGQPGYPLGRDGCWIGLEGDDENTARETGYGIHGTDEPNSIGKNSSLGCIRLNDEDMELVFSLLYEKWSTVETRP
jgi:hypothetical protein